MGRASFSTALPAHCALAAFLLVNNLLLPAQLPATWELLTTDGLEVPLQNMFEKVLPKNSFLDPMPIFIHLLGSDLEGETISLS